MSNVVANICKVSCATAGTGTLTLGAAVTGFLTLALAGVADGSIVTYVIEEDDGSAREIGKGTYTLAGTTLTRDTVYASTNGGAKISCSGSETVSITISKEDFATKFEDTGGTLHTPAVAPSAPSAGDLKVYPTSRVTGLEELFLRGSGMPASPLQRSLRKPVHCITPRSSATAGEIMTYGGPQGPGTISHIKDATFGYMMNIVTTSTSANVAAGRNTGQAVWSRGNQHFRGGFFTYFRFGFAAFAGAYFYAGLGSLSVLGSTGNADDPGGHYAYLQYSPTRGGSGDTNFQFITRDGSTPHVTNTGLAIAINKVYDFYMYCPMGSSTIYWRLVNLTDATEASSGETNNLPGSSTDLSLSLGVINQGAGSTHAINIGMVWVETDDVDTP